ncbi:hypothetical protein BJ508DRAFT_102798 [Ascobolus immersus RN42]|uniref:Uncharacterized protein n=1 Tax=Ascobolus immersus RN42 TaxID=1160509 RepID=A0A3N4I7A7_ASCIM|nr:hypothetical protein BJ508DRAFT_102798 [Ascobolus immersus RN42]
MLEESCYHYMAREYPEILREKEWDCPEAAELTVWVHTITKVLATSNDIAENDVVEISSTLRRAGKVRHCAVHRKAVSTVQLWILLDNAEAALRFLGDGRREKEVLNLRRLVESESRELGLKLEKGEQQLSDELEELDRLREELARREAAARTRQEELEARAKSDMATNLAGLLDHAINKKEPVEISSNNAARVGTARTTAPDTRQTTPSKKTRHTESVEEFRKLGLKPLRPPPSSTCQFNLTKLAASARQASLQKRSPTPQEVSCDGGKVTESQFFDASETLARKAVLEDDPGYSSEEGGTQLHS